MGCIDVVNYDPGTAATKTATALLAMTAFDTTNARIVFNAPASGAVTVRLCVASRGATTPAQIILGILQSSTIIARAVPTSRGYGTVSTAYLNPNEVVFTVTGLTPGNSYTWDAAYSIEVVGSAGALLGYGGPNNTTATDAFGALQFEIWDAAKCLGSKIYDPAAAVTKSTATAIAMTAIDTTNLRITFTAPASGRVMCRIYTIAHGATTIPSVLLGVLDGSTVRARVVPNGGTPVIAAATVRVPMEAVFTIEGLTGGNSYTFDAAYGVETVVASTGLKYGGPNNATTNDAFGAILFEIWDVD